MGLVGMGLRRVGKSLPISTVWCTGFGNSIPTEQIVSKGFESESLNNPWLTYGAVVVSTIKHSHIPQGPQCQRTALIVHLTAYCSVVGSNL